VKKDFSIPQQKPFFGLGQPLKQKTVEIFHPHPFDGTFLTGGGAVPTQKI
jgi:hypothetical protein